MEENKINIIDESGDRICFTIIPNYILNHSTAVAQALYLQLKRLAGDDGIAYPGSRYLRDRLGISQPTLRKEFKYLLEKGWIKYSGEKEVETDGGKQKIKSYKIVNLWHINNTFYKAKRGERIEPPSQRGERIDTQGVKTRGERIGTKEEPLKEEPSFNKNIAKQSFAGKDINDLIELFNPINPTYEKFFSNNTQRGCLERMAKKFGLEKMTKIIKTLEKTNGEKFAPTITTPLQLENKLGDLIVFIKKESITNNQNKIIKI